MKTLIVIGLLLTAKAFGQGFVNLNFEAAVTTNGVYSDILPTDAFPNWIASAPFYYYNGTSLSGRSISIMDTNALYIPNQVEGNFYALLFTVSGNSAISLSQSGLVPATAKSILFWGDNRGMQITFNGAPLTFGVLSTSANYKVYGADISQFAGQTGLLSFSAANGAKGILDNIQFSTVAVPEPTSLSLLGLAGFGFWVGQNRWRSGRGSRSRR